MGHLGFAARDPIFFAHHGNLDKIWSNWNALAAHSQLPAYENPTDPAFRSERWNFYDEKERVVSISASDVLDHQNHLRYSYPAPIARTSSSDSAAAPQEIAVSGPAVPRTAPTVSIYGARLNTVHLTIPIRLEQSMRRMRCGLRGRNG
jgi:polyphenol oxidase